MASRVLSLLAAALTVAVGVLYVAVMHQQDDQPLVWYLALLAGGAVAAAASAFVSRPRPLLIIAVVLTGVASLLGLLSIGIFLLPAAVLCALALARPRPATA